MNKTITITSKGQTTLPVNIRRKFGLDSSGGVLRISFNERKRELTISKPIGVSELSEQASRHIQPGTKPLTNVDEYYQSSRKINI